MIYAVIILAFVVAGFQGSRWIKPRVRVVYVLILAAAGMSAALAAYNHVGQKALWFGLATVLLVGISSVMLLGSRIPRTLESNEDIGKDD